ncbi:hypothetical protein [Maribacter forsetii]|uniref:hypothetical protein n=1 Tax=Maribacter forsetii TaxID=444515 RepID=UPI000569DBB3|nr:hypothetical protein [Maribacter forsetii]
MKNLLSIIIIFLIFNNSFAQKSETELLKNYAFYVEKNVGWGKWSTKYYLSNGLVSAQENYWKNELRSRMEFEYDEFDNVKRETQTFNINDGEVNNVSETKLEYNDRVLIRKEYSYGIVEKYSDYNEYGKPKLIERTDEQNLWPHKEIFEYDTNGNITKHIQYSSYSYSDQPNEMGTTHIEYDSLNYVEALHREFEPKREFPLLMSGPFKYEYEYFKYVYNDLGLWTKKFKTANGKEYLVAKRKYK